MSLWREWIWYRKQAKINVIQALCSFIKPFGARGVRESNLGFTVLQNNVEKLHVSDDELMRELSGLAKNNGFGKQPLTTIPLVLVRSIYVILSASKQCRVNIHLITTFGLLALC